MPNPFFSPSRTMGEARAVIVEGAMLLAFVAAWTALYIAVCPLEAYAATRQEILDNPAILFLGFPFFATAIGLTLALFFIGRKSKKDGKEEPYSNKDDWGM